MEQLEQCPKCGDTGIYNIFLNAEKTKGIHRCPKCGYELRHEPPPPPPPPLAYVPQR